MACSLQVMNKRLVLLNPVSVIIVTYVEIRTTKSPNLDQISRIGTNDFRGATRGNSGRRKLLANESEAWYESAVKK
jgi:hypothetical protein